MTTTTHPGTDSDVVTRPLLRPAAVVMDPMDMTGARATRHSFARALVRRAVAQDWRIERTRFDIDELGCGTAVYRVQAEGHVWSFVAFSQRLAQGERTDRVIAKSWDVTAALVEGEADGTRIQRMAAQVPLQENGRAEAGALIWTRANRSERFFDYVVDRLTRGEQPERDKFGCSPYVMRSTAFYSNGKCGLADFERFSGDHPFAVPYRSHMLAAWLLRELSYDLVEQCAVLRNPAAARLSGDWRRYLGLGNATGLGMVPYVINHPEVLDAWARLREVPLASVLSRHVAPDDADVDRVVALLGRAVTCLAEQTELVPQPYLANPDLAAQVAPVAALLDEWRRTGEVAGLPVSTIWRTLHDAASATGPECRGVVASVLTELSADLDDAVEASLRCDESRPLAPGTRCAEVLATIEDSYAWVSDFDFTDPAQTRHFWFSSADNEEPRRARRGEDPGEQVEHGVDIARAISMLRADLATVPGATSVAEFLLAHPWHRSSVCRVQSVGVLEYGEVRANLLAADFVPLHVQRLQLAVYGMENFNPQSTDWLRVTLLSGAPRTGDLQNRTADDDWVFTPRPQEGTNHVHPA